MNVSRVRALVEQYFGDIPSGPPVPKITVPEVTLSGDQTLLLEDHVQLPRLYVAWHSSKVFTDDDAALDVLSAVLTEGGKSSRLYKRLVYDDQIAQDVSAFQQGRELAGSFWIVATARPGVGLTRIAEAIGEEISRVARDGVKAEERQRAVNGIETDFVRSLEHVGGFGGKADLLNEYHFLTGDPGYVRKDLARYHAVTAGDVASAAGRYLVGEPAVWLSVVPEGKTDLAASEANER